MLAWDAKVRRFEHSSVYFTILTPRLTGAIGRFQVLASRLTIFTSLLSSAKCMMIKFDRYSFAQFKIIIIKVEIFEDENEKVPLLR